jgi:dTDP-glucose 4,6-dehydratase
MSYKSILITGGAGFIGSHLVRRMVNNYPNSLIVNLDSLTYASNINLLDDCKEFSNYQFINEDINNFKSIQKLFTKYKFDAIIHLAAESHVDNSIKNPFKFSKTNIQGTLNLLEAARQHWGNKSQNNRFFHISTDEVFGSLGENGFFNEDSSYDPRSPYSASKASSDHLVRSYFHTYGLPVIISNCSNNFGPGQHSEKLIPLMIQNIASEKLLPVYGNGDNIRDWLYVEDHVEAIDLILKKGGIGETYLIGGNNEKKNIDIIHILIKKIDKLLKRPEGSSNKLIKFVDDRLGHDYRYAIDASKINNHLNWKSSTSFEDGIQKTIEFYISK